MFNTSGSTCRPADSPIHQLSCVASTLSAVRLLRHLTKALPDASAPTAATLFEGDPSLDRAMVLQTESFQVPSSAASGRTCAKQRKPPRKPKPTATERELVFQMAVSTADTDELLHKLKSFDFNINRQQNDDGDYLIHVAAKQGLVQLPLLIHLVKTFQADIDVTNREGMTALMITAKQNNQVLADVLICVLRADQDRRNPVNGHTALHYAAAANNTACASVLIKRGSDFNLDDYLNMRPDELALKHGARETANLLNIHRMQRHQKIKESIERNVSEDGQLVRDTDLFSTDEEGYTLIMAAALCNGVKALEALLAHPQAPINAQHEKTLRTALSYAAGEGHAEAVDVLLKHGAESCIRDMEVRVALQYGIIQQRVNVVALMLERPNCLHSLATALQLANTAELQRLVRSAAARRQREIVTPVLFECAMNGDADKLYCVLEEGDCVNPMSAVGQWPLYLAVENEHLDVVHLICENGADILRKHTTTGNTVLHLAASRGYYDVCKYLLQKYFSMPGQPVPGCEHIINDFNYEGKTPLIMAAEKGHSKVVVLLLQYGASTSLLDSEGSLYECREYEGCQSLIEKNREAHTKLVMSTITCKDGLKKLREIFLPEFDHNLRDANGNTPLMVAAYHQKQDIVKFLLESAVYVAKYMRHHQNRKFKSYDLYEADSGTSSARTSSCFGNNNVCQAGRVCCHGPTDKTDYAAGVNTDSLMGGESYYQCPTCSCSQSKHGKFTSSENLCRQIDSPLRDSLPQFHQPIPEEDQQEPTTAEVEQYDELLNMLQMCDADMLRTNGELPPEDDPDKTLHDNITSLFDSMRTVSRRSSVFVTDIQISHLCAINHKDGVTVFHRLVEGGDNAAILDMFLEKENSGVNIQDFHGLTPLHVACLMKRKKIVEKLVELPYIDLNARTLDGKLPEEMTEDKNIIRLIKKARSQEPSRSIFSPLMSLSMSLFGSSSFIASEDSLDFERLNAQFAQMKRTMSTYQLYNDRNMLLSFY